MRIPWISLACSALASNDLLRSEVYPDSASSSDRVTYCYNRQGQRTRLTDQNGSVHEYAYDLLGRQTADQVSSLAGGVDGAVRRIGQSYEVRGLVERVTSYSDAAGTTPVNQVQNAYNSFGQLKEQYQEHAGAVNPATSPKVQYAYADGSANTIRQTSLTYPSGQVLEYLFDDAAAERLSRVRTLRWQGNNVVRYTYLGVGTFVATDYLEPQVKLDYATGAGANRYAGWDRFGRIVDLLWRNYAPESSSSSDEPPGLVHLQYGYDRAGNRTHRADLVARFYDKHFDERYEYDGLHRLQKFHRGRLVDGDRVIESPTLQQGWRLDATGNWQNFTQHDASDPASTLDQTRVSNCVNEITQIARTVGPAWATSRYDRNGNMTVIPQPKQMTESYQATWDAWNRLVKLEEPTGSGGWQPLAEYQYDGQTWRTLAKNYTAGALDEARHFYYTRRWQIIEERIDSQDNPNQQYVWGKRYVVDLALRQRDTFSETEVLYVMQDGMWSISGLLAGNGDVIERYSFEAYGRGTPHSANFTILNNTQYAWGFRFSGYRLDLRTELHAVRHRVQHSELGVWLSADPWKYHGDISNLFAYMNNHPMNGTDPFGLVLPAAIPVAVLGGLTIGEILSAFGVGSIVACLAIEGCVRALVDAIEKAVEGLSEAAKESLKRACYSYYSVYKRVFEATCRGCNPRREIRCIGTRIARCVHAQTNAACWTASSLARQAYILAGCDFVIPTTVNHVGQILNNEAAKAICQLSIANNCDLKIDEPKKPGSTEKAGGAGLPP